MEVMKRYAYYLQASI